MITAISPEEKKRSHKQFSKVDLYHSGLPEKKLPMAEFTRNVQGSSNREVYVFLLPNYIVVIGVAFQKFWKA